MSQCQNLGVVSQASGMQCRHTTSAQQNSVPCAEDDGSGMSTNNQPVSYYMIPGTSCNIYYGPACSGEVIDDTSIPDVFGNGFICHFINQPTEADAPDGISFKCQDEGASPSSTSTDSARLARRDDSLGPDEASPSPNLVPNKRSPDDDASSNLWSIRFWTTGHINGAEIHRLFEYNGTTEHSDCIEIGCQGSDSQQCIMRTPDSPETDRLCPIQDSCGANFDIVEYGVVAGDCTVYYGTGFGTVDCTTTGVTVAHDADTDSCSWNDDWALERCDVVDIWSHDWADGLSFQCSGASGASSSSVWVQSVSTPNPSTFSTVGVSTASSSMSLSSTVPSSTSPTPTDPPSTGVASTDLSSIGSSSSDTSPTGSSSTNPSSSDASPSSPSSTTPLPSVPASNIGSSTDLSSISTNPTPSTASSTSSTSTDSVPSQPSTSTPVPAPASSPTFTIITITTTATLVTSVPIAI